MEMKITTLEGKEAGSVKLPDAIFGLEPRTDIIQRCVNWQLAKRQRGTHKTKGRAEIWRTGKKMYAQKGTGGARHGSARVPQFQAVAALSVRWFAATPSICRRKFAPSRSSMRCLRKPRTAASSFSRRRQ